VRTTLSLIARPPFFGEVTRLVQEIQRAKQDRLDNIAGKPASSTDEVAQPQRTAQERLRELDSLRQDDLVSEAEYLAKRQRILDEL